MIVCWFRPFEGPLLHWGSGNQSHFSPQFDGPGCQASALSCLGPGVITDFLQGSPGPMAFLVHVCLKAGTHRPNQWTSEAFRETWTRSGTNMFGVFSCIGSFRSCADVVCSDSTCKVWRGWLSAVWAIGISDWWSASESAQCVGRVEYCVRLVFLCTPFRHSLFSCFAVLAWD